MLRLDLHGSILCRARRFPLVYYFRMIKNHATRLLALIGAIVMTVPAWAAAPPASTPPVLVSRLVPTQPSGADAEQVGVVVFFDFSRASQRMLKHLDQWAANAGSEVVIDREPLVTPVTAPFARAFMTARTLGMTKPILGGLFNIKPDPTDPTAVKKQFRTLFKTWGIGDVEFNAAWQAQVTDNGYIRAQTLAQRYGVTQAPAIIVDGIWRLTPTAPGAMAALMQALNSKVSNASLIASENQ